MDFDRDKRPKKLPKNKMGPVEEVKPRPSTIAIRLILKEFSTRFLNEAYNMIMAVVKDNLVRQRAQQNDESYYLWSIRFFMEFNRKCDFQVCIVPDKGILQCQMLR